MSETKDALAILQNIPDIVARPLDTMRAAEEAILAERQRHAEEVEELRHKLQWAVNERNDLREDLTEVSDQLRKARSLLQDVRLCLKYCDDDDPDTEGGIGELARRLLAADFLREPCPECHMVERCKMSCSRGGSKGARLFGSPIDESDKEPTP